MTIPRSFITGLVSVAVTIGVASAQELKGDYGRGFCAAVDIMQGNRDHYRALAHFPAETYTESMKRIYEKWPPRPPAGFEEKTIVDEMLNTEMAGIDLYVVVPPQICEGVPR